MESSSCSPSSTDKIALAVYIFRRLQELGIFHVFGCPGDFNLHLLDHLYTVPSMTWVGTCNELNAAYAADGYARIRGIPGALVTTYGVGELSAINGISGAYSEHVPIIHIVGTTSRLGRRDRIMIHHTLGESWDHDTFQRMSEPVRSASAFLIDDATFTAEVDRVIATAVRSRRPVYIFIPMDTPDLLVDPTPLSTPLDLEIRNLGREQDEEEIVTAILAKITSAKKPVFLVDALAHRYGLSDCIAKLLSLTKFPAFVTPLAKSVVDETSEAFRGLYNGQLSPSLAVKDQVESSDAIIHIGAFPTDSNTGGWSQSLPQGSLIDLRHDRVSVATKSWQGIHFSPIVKRLLAVLETGDVQFPQSGGEKLTNGYHAPKAPTGNLDQHHFWKQFSPFLRPGDCIIAEVGSAQYGTLELALPHDTTFFTQLYYSCIGFTVGALLGALVARREQGKVGRVLLFIGDGSLHMTVQELSTIIRYGFNPMIILINNSGYTIERVIHGPEQKYNYISESWDYQNMLKFFGAKNSRSYSARTYEQLENVLQDHEFIQNKTPQLLEVFLDKFDSPWMLTGQVNIVQSKSSRQLRDWDAENGRHRHVLDSNLWQSKFALTQSPSNLFVESRGLTFK